MAGDGMKDLTERLRRHGTFIENELITAVADALEAQAAEIERLRRDWASADAAASRFGDKCAELRDEIERLRSRTVTLPPPFAWASVTQPLVITDQVKDLWLKVSSKRVENYIEPLVLLEDVRAALCAAGVEVQT